MKAFGYALILLFFIACNTTSATEQYLSRQDDSARNAYQQKAFFSNNRYWALIIGIDRYRYWPVLETAVSDATAVADVLIQDYGFDRDNVITLLNGAATEDAIIKSFIELQKQIGSNDSLLIYYAGHGHLDSFNIGSWVPIEAKQDQYSAFIDTDRINRMLAEIPAKHIFLVADACYSGSLFAARGVKSFRSTDRYFEENFNRISRQALSSGGIETVSDQGRNNHSIFAYYFLRELQTNQAAYLAASQLSAKVERLVASNSQQEPQWSHLLNTGDENGEFFFVKKSFVNDSVMTSEIIDEYKHDKDADTHKRQNNIHALTVEKSYINWSEGYAEVVATGTADVVAAGSRVQAELIARNNARNFAYIHLFEMLSGMVVKSRNGGEISINYSGSVPGGETIAEHIEWVGDVPIAKIKLRANLPHGNVKIIKGDIESNIQ